eukprot:tig00000140_g8467.t1
MVQLRKLGYGRVVHAGDGREALEAARAAEARGEPFDLLLSDIMMPGLDGLELARRMRAELPPGRVPYSIALSANVGAHDRQECAAAGFDAFLAKPARAPELADALGAAAAVLALRAQPPLPALDMDAYAPAVAAVQREL